MTERIEDIKRPLVVGELVIVPCITYRDEFGEEFMTPVLNHPHSDKENGQSEIHYHADTRFINLGGNYVQLSNKRFPCGPSRLILGGNSKLESVYLRVVSPELEFLTPYTLILRSKLKHKCIKKGKCPHRGYDLSGVESKYDETYGGNIIRCPLHSLEFDASTKELVEHLYKYFK